jgi:hypothetical protein
MNERITALQSKAAKHGFNLALEPLPIPSASGFEDLINDAQSWQLDRAEQTLNELIEGQL